MDAFPGLLRDYNITTVIDVPCGDFHWMSRVNLEGRKYIGGDIVKELIEDNQKPTRQQPARSFA